jgi:hypothetical protein
MTGTINKSGYLLIDRNGKMISQYCPKNENAFCGDMCPLFGEPEQSSPIDVSLEICQGKVLHFTKIKDERLPWPEKE